MAVRTPATRPQRSATISGDDHRERIVVELFATEQTYVAALHTCIVYYYEKIKTCDPPVMTPKDIDSIFHSFDQVYNINLALLNDLEVLNRHGQLSHRIGEAFRNFIPYLRVYYQFVGNSGVSLQTLGELERSPAVGAFLEALRQTIPGDNQLDLRGYLIMPVQRLPRYVLLLTELVGRTPPTFADFAALQSSLDEMKKLTTSANQAITDAERRRRMFELEGRISGFPGRLVEPHRYFIREGELLKVCRKAPKPRYFYLFNDLLVYGIGDEHGMRVSEVAAIEKVVVRAVPDTENAFEVLSEKKSFVVYSQDQKDRDEWLAAIEAAIAEQLGILQTRNQPALDTFIMPVFIPDNQAATCMGCNAVFTIITRRHHCRFCGSCVCATCSRFRVPLPPQNTLVRACATCFRDRVLTAARPTSGPNHLRHTDQHAASPANPQEPHNTTDSPPPQTAN